MNLAITLGILFKLTTDANVQIQSGSWFHKDIVLVSPTPKCKQTLKGYLTFKNFIEYISKMYYFVSEHNLVLKNNLK